MTLEQLTREQLQMLSRLSARMACAEELLYIADASRITMKEVLPKDLLDQIRETHRKTQNICIELERFEGVITEDTN